MMKVVYANSTGHVSSSQGHTVLVILGTHWPASDPIVKAYPHMFSDDPVNGLYFSQPPVELEFPEDAVSEVAHQAEQATAEPGSKRPVRGTK